MHLQRITDDFPDLPKVERLAKEAFPPEEYLSPADILRLPGLDFWAMYDKEQFVGFLVVKTTSQMAYLFFLAIVPSLRSHGYGSAALQKLKTLYPGKVQTVDMEMLDERAPNNAQRKKRRAFYLRNGYQPTGKFMSYYGVDYEILYAGDSFSFDAFEDLLNQMRPKFFTPGEG